MYYKIALFFAFHFVTVMLANEFGADYDWIDDLEMAKEKAREVDKPVMLIIHKSWCGACKNLKPKFADSKEILALSTKFVMIHLKDNQEPSDQIYAPDGAYIPRIIFLSPEGRPMHEFYNELGSEKYKYFYSQIDEILLSMKSVLRKYNSSKTDKEGEL